MDNKVVQTLARAFVQVGYRAVRFNFRGVGASQGQWDEGHGEIDDAMAVVDRFPRCGAAAGARWFFVRRLCRVAHRVEGRRRGSTPRGWCWWARPLPRFGVASAAPDTLVIHGEADDVVPLQATLDWARPLQLPVVVMPGVGHFFHGQLTRLRDLVVQAWSRLSGARRVSL